MTEHQDKKGIEMKIYLAGPLFSEAEQNWLRSFKGELQDLGCDVVWPYELFNQAEIAAWGDTASRRIMEGCRDALVSCDLVVALLDGTQVDDGTAWELGFAHAKELPAVGIRTDARYCGETPGARVNAMIAGSIPVCLSKKELFNWLKKNMLVEKGMVE